MPYPWTTDQDVWVDNAIIVSIGGADAVMIAFGPSYSPPAASVVWHSMVTAEGFFPAGSKTDFQDVAEALARAEVLRKQMGAGRVVVSIQERGMWRDKWGELAQWEGIR
jgi:hypothetical protein